MTQNEAASLPIAVVGAGPVGLAAAANLIERGERALVLEAGTEVGHSIRAWSHVSMFSPWRWVIDPASARLLEEAGGWRRPDPGDLPSGADLVNLYLGPLSEVPKMAAALRLGHRVVSISRRGLDKVRSAGREAAPFVLHVALAGGETREVLARGVIDASGTWTQPNPMGADGRPALGESELAGRLAYGIPSLEGDGRERYAGRRTLVLGAGHSAVHSLLVLADLAAEEDGTRVIWGIRREHPERAFGGGADDELPARGALGTRLRRQVEEGKIEVCPNLQVAMVRAAADGRLEIVDFAGEIRARVDEVIVATGARPDLAMLRELRLNLDPALESPAALGPLIDPNVHSCGTVPPHGARELAQPEPGFFVIGAKSYGRAPTFLLATGYEQARSVVAHLVGDEAAAREVRLTLPETGVCSAGPGGEAGPAAGAACCAAAPAAPEESQAACCGPAAQERAAAGDACCDRAAKAGAACC